MAMGEFCDTKKTSGGLRAKHVRHKSVAKVKQYLM